MRKVSRCLVLFLAVMFLCVACENEKIVSIKKTHHQYTAKEFLFYHPEFSMWIDETEISATTPIDVINTLVKENIVVTLALKNGMPDQQKKIYVNSTDLYRFSDSEIYVCRVWWLR